jgi:hypothetical protein
MSLFYEGVGRLVVYVVMRRFGRQIRIAGVVGLVGIALAGVVGVYLHGSRDVEEG